MQKSAIGRHIKCAMCDVRCAMCEVRGARKSGVINIFLVSRLDGIRRLGCVGAGKVCAGIGGRGDDCMDCAQPNRRQSVSMSDVWAKQNCCLRRLGACSKAY